MKRSLTAVLALAIVFCLFYVRSAIALEVPPLSGHINDTAAMLSQQNAAELEQLLTTFEASDSTQIVLLTIPSLEGAVLEEFSLQVAEKWGIGQQGKDNGALLLVSRDDRKMRIEVGYGLEGSLTDMTAGRIISRVIVPRFREGKFDQGISDGLQAMMQAVRGEFTAPAASKQQTANSDFAGLLFLLFFVYSFIGRILQKKKGLAAISGGIISPVMGALFSPLMGWWLLSLVPLGILGGLFAASVTTGSVSRGGGGFYLGGGGFGGSSGGFGGGFSGGGGGFGGGGASGGW